MIATTFRTTALLIALALAPAAADTPAVEASTPAAGKPAAKQTAVTAPNRLIDSLSPYLLQHAYNPVDWYPWGPEAFEKARRENKPVFLSIGYSTCHWCHVMARESFEDPELAAYLNAHFVSIKVDREERPDIDAVYMTAAQVLNGYGGWPLTALLDHAQRPFHVGTYYPPYSRDGHIGMNELLEKVHALWSTQRDRIDEAAGQLTDAVRQQADESRKPVEIDSRIIQRALLELASEYDAEDGGFGNAPKFPPHGKLMLLQRMAEAGRPYSASAEQMLARTLESMARGGIHDHLRGGFHRYSVDARWQLPHFEKMLYTQALLAESYTRLYALKPDPLYRQTAQRTLDFVLTGMMAPGGGFYSALDAESIDAASGEKIEGAYYLWTTTEIRQGLTQGCREWAFATYALDDAGNFADPDHEGIARNVLYREETSHAGQPAVSEQRMDTCRQEMLDLRERRPAPGVDDKVITAWNGMMIRALVEASKTFGRTDYLDAAVRTAAFLLEHLVDGDGDLLRRWRNGVSGQPAVLEDYAWLVHGLLALHAATGERKWLEHAVRLQRRQQALFYDADDGGYFNATESEDLIVRMKIAADDTLPAANAIAVLNLGMLADALGEAEWRRLQIATVAAFSAAIDDDTAVNAGLLAGAWRALEDEAGAHGLK